MIDYKARILSFFAAAFLACLPAQSHAQSSAAFSGGSMQVGYDSRNCAPGLAGAIRYDSSSGNLQFCDGANWKYADCGMPCTLPAGCTTVGSTCANGSIFIGMMVYGTSCVPLFATDVNQSTSNAWRSVGSGFNAGTLSFEDGRANQNWIANHFTIANFPAFNTCDALSRHSNTDWYLPAQDELNLLQRSGIINVNQNYWSSTEASDTDAWLQNGTSSEQSFTTKSTAGYVRCVRRN